MSETIYNGIITYTKLGIEDHGLLTFTLGIDFDEHAHCGFGGCSFGASYLEDDSGKSVRKYRNYPYTFELLIRILETVGVGTWEELKGKYVRVKTNSRLGKIIAIGHIMKEKWFNIEEFYKEKESGY